MNRAQLYHAIRTACTILEQDSVVIIGSQAILGSFDEDELPLESTMSNEIDTLPYGETHEEIVMLADRVEGVAGEWSDFDIEHGFHIDGVDDTTAILPDGWRDRLVPISAESTVNILTGQRYVGLCLEPHDLCAAKLCAGREKDHQFVRALLSSRLVDPVTIAERLALVSVDHWDQREAAETWLQSWRYKREHVDGL